MAEPTASLAPIQAAPGAPVIVVSIDTLRSDRLPVYGYQGVETPAIDALRRDAILFERAYSHTPLTLPSHLSIFTGTLPGRHGVRDNQGYRFDSGRAPYLPQLLQRQGYATGAAVSAYVLRRATGLAAGFDFYDDDIEEPGGVFLVGRVARPGEETLERALEWLASVAGRPFFLFLHLFEPHFPYEPPEPFASRYSSAYDGEVAAADAVVGKLLAELRRQGLYERAIIVLLSDHGEGLGDHGEEEHGVFLYRETLQVPLILKLPGGARAGSSVSAAAQLIDLMPTLAYLSGVLLPADLPGTVLLDLAESEPAARQIYAETFYPRLHYGWSELRSLLHDRHHYIEAPKAELYDLIADPEEQDDILQREQELAAQMRQMLATYDRTLEPPGAVEPEERAKLAALGYLGSAVTESAALPDPKVKYPTLRTFAVAYGHYRGGEYREAVHALRDVVRENPRMLDAWEYLGESLRHLGRITEALEAYRHAFELAGGEPRLAMATAWLHLELGDVDEALALTRYALSKDETESETLGRLGLELLQAGRLSAAIEILGPAAESGDTRAMSALALALTESGQQQPARAWLERALAKEPDNARAHELLGIVEVRTGHWSEAAQACRRALEIDSGRAQAWNTLGVALYRMGRRLEALDAWQRAVEEDRTDYDALFNLAFKAYELGRLEQSRRALERFLKGAPPHDYGPDLEKARDLLRRIEN